VNASAGAKSGTYSATNIGASTFAQTRAGATGNELHIPQSTWNGDKLDGTGPSKFVADWTKGNVFQILIQYLGFGAIKFQVECYPPDANNSTFVTVHTLRIPNTLTVPSFRNPSFPFTMAVYSAGSTTNLNVKSASFAGFIEGKKFLQGNRFTYYAAPNAAVNSTAYLPLFTILNGRTFSNNLSDMMVNQSVINIISVSAAQEHNNPSALYLIKNGTLAGTPVFTQYATNSVSYVDTSATAITFTSNSQIQWVGHLSNLGEIDHDFDFTFNEMTLQPGEYLSLVARSTSGNPFYFTGSINSREDQ
jgi:hypothetical protein